MDDDKNKDENGKSGVPVPPKGFEPFTDDDGAKRAVNSNASQPNAPSESSSEQNTESSDENTNECTDSNQRGNAQSFDFGASQGFQNPQKPRSGNAPALSETEKQELLSVKRFSIYSIGGSFISFLFGGSLLALISLICGIVCYKKTKRFNDKHQDLKDYAPILKKRAIIAIVIPAVALALNLTMVALLMPVIMEAAQTGDYSMILSGGVTNGATNTTWG